MHVLVVEDDVTMAALLERALREEGETVVVERNGLAAVETALRVPFDVIVLDVMLPGLDGFGVVHRLRHHHCPTPVLMLTARDTSRDLIHGLNLGADDYLTKPFALEVFFTRLRAAAGRGAAPERRLVLAGGLTLHAATGEVLRGGRRVELTRTEYNLLELLASHAGRIVTPDQIIETVWGFGAAVEQEMIDALVRLLRRKLEAPGEMELIHTIRGVGYSLREREA